MLESGVSKERGISTALHCTAGECSKRITWRSFWVVKHCIGDSSSDVLGIRVGGARILGRGEGILVFIELAGNQGGKEISFLSVFFSPFFSPQRCKQVYGPERLAGLGKDAVR